MFQTKLSCDNCDYATAPFVSSYIPASDTLDVVFQDQHSQQIRVLKLSGITERISSSPTEEQVNERISQLCELNRHQHERQIDTWCVPDEFEPIECPCCGKQLVRLQIISIV